MPVGYTVDFRSLGKQLEKFRRFSYIADKHLKRAMGQSTDMIAGSARQGAPGSVSGAISTNVRQMAPMAVDGVIEVHTSPPVKGLVLEFGRKPGRRMPPPDAFGEGPEAWAIARAIGRRGTKKKRFLWRGYIRNRKRIDQAFKDAIDQIAEELAVKGDSGGGA